MTKWQLLSQATASKQDTHLSVSMIISYNQYGRLKVFVRLYQTNGTKANLWSERLSRNQL